MIEKIYSLLHRRRNNPNKLKSTIYGLAVGDALGVPVEFAHRKVLKNKPVVGMCGYGTHNQPIGTWSDDTSLTLALLDSLKRTYDLKDIAQNFLNWRDKGCFTANGRAFDIGFTTHVSIDYLIKALDQNLPLANYSDDEMLNGNGSLMRIIPIYFYLIREEGSLEDNFKTIYEVSALTHGHIRAAYACLAYMILFDELNNSNCKFAAYTKMQTRMLLFFNDQEVSKTERKHFDRLLHFDISKLPESEVQSSGYVIHSLEASIWCFLNHSNYKETVLSAVNLGDDSDTTGAITGGLAGFYYGFDDIPKEWISVLKAKELIDMHLS